MNQTKPLRKVRDAQLLIASFAGLPEVPTLREIERELRVQRVAFAVAPKSWRTDEWYKSLELLERTVSRLKNAIDRRLDRTGEHLCDDLDRMPVRGTC